MGETASAMNSVPGTMSIALKSDDTVKTKQIIHDPQPSNQGFPAKPAPCKYFDIRIDHAHPNRRPKSDT